MPTSKTKLTFTQWLAQVNVLCITKTGLRIEDLEDYLWADAYEKNKTPKQAFKSFYNIAIKPYM